MKVREKLRSENRALGNSTVTECRRVWKFNDLTYILLFFSELFTYFEGGLRFFRFDLIHQTETVLDVNIWTVV